MGLTFAIYLKRNDMNTQRKNTIKVELAIEAINETYNTTKL